MEVRVNTETGEVIEHPARHPLQDEIDEHKARIDSLTKVILSRDRALSQLRNELAEAMGDEPEADDVKKVLEYWARKAVEMKWWTRKPVIRPASERWISVRARLRGGYTVEELMAAVDGALRPQPEADHRVCGKCGNEYPKQAWMDAVSIFRNEQNVDRHIHSAKDPENQLVPRAAGRATQPPPQHLIYRETPFDRVVKAFRDEYGHDRVEGIWNANVERYDMYMVPCPIHPDQPEWLMTAVVTAKDRVSAPQFSCTNGCLPADIAEATREIMRGQNRRQQEAVSRATAAQAKINRPSA